MNIDEMREELSGTLAQIKVKAPQVLAALGIAAVSGAIFAAARLMSRERDDRIQ
ncbi:hypothetical protein [Paramicrobacterium humi]|uniref:hypothetical protein n=1 Tax=Paramicrobacterium humi TaxID=640635 RepID=UPI0015A2D711|nr:hypothetical protein [Microbacterium humi]